MAAVHALVPEATHHLPAEFANRVKALARPDGWDEEGGSGLSDEVCDAALRLVADAIAAAPALGLPRASHSPARGAVALTWRFPGRSMTLFVGPLTQEIEFQCEGPGFDYRAGTTDRASVLRDLERVGS
jgi:hypothetical protein